MWLRRRWGIVLFVVAGALVWLLLGARSPSGVLKQPIATNDDQPRSRTAPDHAAAGAISISSYDAESGVATDAGDGTSADARTADGENASDIISEIRAVLVEAPKLAEEIARAHRERYPDAADADERDALLVAAIYNQHQPDRAKFETRQYLRRHPNGRYAEELMRVTGAHMPVPVPRPSSSP